MATAPDFPNSHRTRKKIAIWITNILIITSLACSGLSLRSPASTAASTAASPTPTASAPVEPLPPVVVETIPVEGSEITSSGGFTVSFSQPMNREAVEGAFSIEPSLQGSLDWLDQDRSLRFTPSETLPFKEELTVRFGIQARAANGLGLGEPVELHFQTPASLQVTERIPALNDVDVSPDNPIVATFNQPVVPLGANSADMPPAFTLAPAAEGRGEWLNTSTYIFHPDPPLLGGNPYRVTMDPALVSTAGAPLSGDDVTLEWSFTTAPPRLVSVSPSAEQALLPDSPITLEFNQPMDTASLEQNLSLTDEAGSPVDGEFTWSEDAHQVTFTPAPLLSHAARYTLDIPDAILGKGGTPLTESDERVYRTTRPLDIESTNPAQGETLGYFSGYARLAINFNNPIRRQKLDDLIQIDPPIYQKEVYASENEQTVAITGILDANTLYTVSVSPDLQDRWGRRLDKPAGFTFRTARAAPNFNIPILQSGTGAIFFMADDPSLKAQATNIPVVRSQSARISLEQFIQLNEMSKEQTLPADIVPFTDTRDQTLQAAPDRPAAVDVSITEDGQPLETGLYFFNVSTPGVELENSYYLRPFLGVSSSINLLMKRSPRQVLVWAVDLSTRQPIRGETVTLYDNRQAVVATVVTDDDGIARFELPGYDEKISYYAVTGEPGQPDFGMGHVGWNSGIAPWDLGISSYLYNQELFTYIYTDRPIYQPGQTVNFRLVLRQEEYGQYQLPAEKTVSVNVFGEYSTVSGERPLLTTLSLPVTEYGTASGTFILPADAAPGTYSLEMGDLGYAQLNFEVAAYRKPEFELTAAFKDTEGQAGGDLEAEINAAYYFGAPAGDLEVHWTLYARGENLPMPEQWLSGKQDYSWTPFNLLDYSLYGGVIKEGDVKTGADGNVRITIPAEELSGLLAADQRQVLTIEVTAQDESQLSVSGRAQRIVHPGQFYIGVKPETWMGRAGVPLGFQVQTVDWNVSPAGGRLLRAELQKVTWESADTSGVFSYADATQPVFTTVSSTSFRTDSQGRARLEFVPPEPGTYRLEITGDAALTQALTWVGGAAGAAWPELPDQRLTLGADSETYRPGDTANILIPNPFPEKTTALITLEKGDIVQTSVLEIDAAGYEYSLPIRSGYAPNVYLNVTLIGKTASGKPDFRTGILNIDVEPQTETLNVEVTVQPPAALPGSEVNLNFRVTDWQGVPVQGEFSVALVDQAVLALMDPNAPDILTAFYDHVPLGVQTSLPLSISSQRAVIFAADGRGGGGMGMSQAVVRSDFQDTAFWSGNIETDTAGMASVAIKLPDNLTTWVAAVRGLTKDTRVGEATTNVVTGKDLLIRPVTPRFLVVGDHVEISALVHNNTPASLDPTVALQSIGFVLDNAGQETQTITIPPGERHQVSWLGTVQDVDAVEFIFSTQAGDLQDAARPEAGSLPVLKYSTPQTYAATGILPEAGDRLEVISLPTRFTPTGGSLEVELSPSLAAAILSGLEALKNFPSDMIEANLSRLLANVQTYRVLKDTAIESPTLRADLEATIRENLKQITAGQNEDGGWGWFAGQNSQDYLSAYVLFGITLAQQSGILVDANVIQKAQDYLLTTLESPETLTQDWQLDRLVFKHFALVQSGISTLDSSALFDYRDRYSPWAKALLVILYHQSDPSGERVAQLVTDLKGSALRTASGAHWEETLPRWVNLTTPILNTAIVAMALAAVDPASDLLNDAVRYLIAHRRAGGGWYSSYDTAWTLMALNEVLKSTGDLQAGYSFSASLNDRIIIQGQAGGVTALTPVDGEVPYGSLLPGVPNALRINRSSGPGRLYYRTALQLHQPVESAQPVQKGLAVQRNYYRSGEDCASQKCTPLESYRLDGPADPVLVKLTLTLSQAAYYLVVEDWIPAGTEIINLKLKTSQLIDESILSSGPFDPFAYGYGWWYFNDPQIYDDHIRWMAEYLPAGTYELTYRILPYQPGEFRVLPAHAYAYYFPEFEGSSSGQVFKIQK